MMYRYIFYMQLVFVSIFFYVVLCKDTSRNQIDKFHSIAKTFDKSMANYTTALHYKSSVVTAFNKIIPPLTYEYHKGQAGRIGVIGGSEEYTGAPYFAGITALKVGADLSHVICSKSASPVIKSYSPELIVHPLLDQENGFESIKDWLARLHAVVIGPGLGRDMKILSTVRKIIEFLMVRNTPIVVDADGLFLITEDPGIIRGYSKAILTPNVVEFRRLLTALKVKVDENSNDQAKIIEETVAVSRALGDVVIVRKGSTDVIAKGDDVALVEEVGSPRRCGGQGDLLSGALNVFAYWAYRSDEQSRLAVDPGITAAFAACTLTRRCAAQAFAKHYRATTTSDLIDEIESVFRDKL